jgi:iron complex outermembrane recepter protein
VVVTATRRSENLEKVPIAITVVNGDQARAADLNDLQAISSEVPSLNFRQAASNKDEALFLRGLGTVSTSPGVEPTVSTVIDGVVYARQGQATLDLIDIDRLEVLRGPQGTLFGKNASGGVLNVVTKNPTPDFSGFGEFSYFGGGGEERLRAGVSGPINDKVSALVDVLATNYGGNVKNVFNGQDVNGYSHYGAHTKIKIDPAPNLQIFLNADYLYSDDTTPTGEVTRSFLTAYPTNKVTQYPAFASALGPVVPSADNTEINSDYNTYAHDQNGGTSAEIDYTLGRYTLTSITAYRGWENVQHQDQSRLPLATSANPSQHDVGSLNFDQFSQELRIASPQGGLFDYVLGAYYLTDTDREDYRRDTTTVSGAKQSIFTGIAHYGTSDGNESIFGEGHLNFTPKFRAILGARIIHDDLDYHFARTSTSPVPVTGIQTAFNAGGSTHPSGYSDRLGLQYDLNRNDMAYFTFARGYKGPAYNVSFSMLPQDTGALKSETSDDYEVGLKTRSFAGRLEANVDAFLDDVNNYQVNFYDIYNGSPVTRLINAGQVSTRGVEADLVARPIPLLTLTGAMAYTNARIDDFTCPQGTAASCQVNGKPLPFAPRWKSNVSALYTVPLRGDLKLALETDFNWRSQQQYSINQTPDTEEKSYGVWNGSVALTGFRNWYVALLAKNLLNKHYDTLLSDISSGVIRYTPRDNDRYFGFDVKRAF